MISERNGAVEDLAQEGTEKWISRFDPTDPKQFVTVLNERIEAIGIRVPEGEVVKMAEFYRPNSQADRAFQCITKSQST
jgi:hypothetical protein